jgi:citronellol/citronellal dehydrogenase
MDYKSLLVTGEVIRIDRGASCNTKALPLQEHTRSRPFNGFHLAESLQFLGGPKEH